MSAGLVPQALAACGLPLAWAQAKAWSVLDTAFGDGTHFLATWQAWRGDALRPTMLHYVAIAKQYGPSAGACPPLPCYNANTELSEMACALALACANVSQGFNRVWLDGGRVSLTLCLGDLKTMLAQQAFRAHTLYVGGAPLDQWHLKHLGRLCQRGSRFWSAALSPQAKALFSDAGFEFNAPAPVLSPSLGQTHPAANGALESGVFNPPWRLSNSRQNRAACASASTQRCVIVGAGIAGATVAHALAVRGWQVTVLDAHEAPAGGASGVPAGLVVPQNSADNNPRSRMIRHGTHLVLQLMQRYLTKEQDWDLTGVQERKPSSPHSATEPVVQWHAQAGWVKPAALVRALLNHSGIAFVGQAEVATLRWQEGEWLLLSKAGHTLASAEVVVLASALACEPLLQTATALNDTPSDAPGAQSALPHLGLRAAHGTLTRGLHGPMTGSVVSQSLPAVPAFPAFPVNGHGSFLPRVPLEQGDEWIAGATFDATRAASSDSAAQHQFNWERLHQLLPATAAALAPAFASGNVRAWSGTRCTSHDRLPLVGRVQHGQLPHLWMSTALGSRGLSLACVCAELLAAQLCQEPLPLESRLVRCLELSRLSD